MQVQALMLGTEIIGPCSSGSHLASPSAICLTVFNARWVGVTLTEVTRDLGEARERAAWA
jgi:hypothetical protein